MNQTLIKIPRDTMRKVLHSGLIVLLAGSLSFLAVSPADAWLFHATGRRAAQRILSKGINPSYFQGKARFGKGFYTSRGSATALAEKGQTNSVLRLQEGKTLKAKTWDLRHPVPEKIKQLLAPKKVDLRGTVKQGVVGPKLGRQLGHQAGREGKAIQYRSAKTGGSNLVIPKRVLQEHPNLVRPVSTR